MKPEIAIVNSDTFGQHFKEHISELETFSTIRRVRVPITISDEDLSRELKGVSGIIASVTPNFPKAVLESLDSLLLLSRHGIGCNNVDSKTATSLGIIVSRVAGEVEQEAVAEQAVNLMLASGRMAHAGYISVLNSRWSDRSKYLGVELKGKTVGLIGIGNIGRRVSEILALGFKSKVLAYDPYLTSDEIKARNAEPVSLEKIISDSDIISFHCPLTDETKRMFSKEVFQKVKKGILLVNTCRGELLDEDALCEALDNKTIRAYGADVVEGEPIDGNHRLLKYTNVMINPHLGDKTDESLRQMGETMVRDMKAVFVKGELPGTILNKEVLNENYRAKNYKN